MRRSWPGSGAAATGRFSGRDLVFRTLVVTVVTLLTQTARVRGEFHCSAFPENLERRTGLKAVVSLETRCWPAGSRLNVEFVDGAPGIRREVEVHAREWCRHANLEFVFAPPGQTPAPVDIRITFHPSPGIDGFWSVLGAQSRQVCAMGRPSMMLQNYDRLTDVDKRRGVVLHEFGHALGLYHEHMSPLTPIRWNRPVVYRELKEQWGWDPAQVDRQILQPLTRERTSLATEFDVESVMLYEIPARWTLNGISTPRNTRLSRLDGSTAARLYPRTTAPPPVPPTRPAPPPTPTPALPPFTIRLQPIPDRR